MSHEEKLRRLSMAVAAGVVDSDEMYAELERIGAHPGCVMTDDQLEHLLKTFVDKE